jgi:hypothetical protein
MPFQNLNERILPLLSSDPHNVSQALAAKYRESPLLIFEYRFIKFEWNSLNKVFEPIKFNCELPFDTLRAKFTNEDDFYTE